MKNKKITKLLSLVLSSALLMTACGSESVSPSSQTEESVEQITQQSVEQVETKNYWELLDSVSDTSELPDWTGDTLEITVWKANGTGANFGTISDTNVTWKEVERVTGVKVNLEDSFDNNGDSIDAKLPKLLASKEFPTIIYGYSIDSQLKDLYNHGYLADLSSYYENGALSHVTYWLPMEEMGSVLYDNYKGEDGGLYVIPGVTAPRYYDLTGYTPEEYDIDYYSSYASDPYIAGGQTSRTAVYVRDDILQALYPDAMTLEEIKTQYVEKGSFTEEEIFDVDLKDTDDFVKLLKDIKQLISSGDFVGLDGKPVEVTYGPHTGEDNWCWMATLPTYVAGFSNTDYFAVSEDNGNGFVDSSKYAWESDAFIDWMRVLNSLVREDVIAKNSVVDNAASFDEKFLNGHYAVLYGKVTENIDGSSAGWGYRPVWFDTEYDEYNGFYALGTTRTTAIFKDSVPEGQMDQLVHFLDYCNSTIGMNNFYWGPASAGLFTVDAEGNRRYVDKDVEACMERNEDNGMAVKYGLVNSVMSEPTEDPVWLTGGHELLKPSYLAAYRSERLSDAKSYLKAFCPALISGKSRESELTAVVKGNALYNYTSIEGIKTFWSAREGFENQLKKVIVAESDAKFEKELENLAAYASDNGLTEATLKEYENAFIEKNRAALEAAGMIK